MKDMPFYYFARVPDYLSFLFLGLYAIAGQILIIREFLVVFYGNELSLAIIFLGWFLGITAGAWSGSRVAERSPRPERGFSLLQAAMCVTAPVQVFSIRLLRGFLGVKPGEYIPFLDMLPSIILLVLPLSFLVGLIFPFACKTLRRLHPEGALQIGYVYALEGLGSVIGGFIMTYYLIGRLHPINILLLFGIIMIANGVLACSLRGGKAVRSSVVINLLFCVALLVAWATGLSDRLQGISIRKRWEGFNPGIRLIASMDSKYQNLSLGILQDQYSLYGNGQLIDSFPDDYTHAILAHFVLNQHPGPAKILLIGAGAAGLLKQILQYRPNRVDYVELDEKVLTMIIPYLPPEDRTALKDERVSVHYTDGRFFVKGSSEKYDLIFLNLPDPSTAMLNRFYTLDFFKEAKRLLRKNGVLATSLTSAVNYIGQEVGEYTASIYRTLKKIFPTVLVTPGDRIFYFASSSPEIPTLDPVKLAARFQGHGIRSSYFSPFHFEILLPEERVRFINSALDRFQTARLNTDWRPISYFHNLVLWDLFSAPKYRTSVFERLSAIKITWFLIPVGLFALGRLLFLLFKGRNASGVLRFNCLFAIATTGFAAMALEIVLIFAFQNIYGYLYQKIGAIVGLFMAGLALGGWLMSRWLVSLRKDPVKLLGLLEGLIAAYSASLPLMLYYLMAHSGGMGGLSEEIFMVMVGIAGLMTGIEFPLASGILLGLDDKIGRVAGLVDGFDHLGACIGAAITGSILIPLLGTIGACIIVGLLNMTSLLFLSVSWLPRRA